MSQSAKTMSNRFRLARESHTCLHCLGGNPGAPPSRIAIAWQRLAVFALLGVLSAGPAQGAEGDRVRTVTLPALDLIVVPNDQATVEGNAADNFTFSVDARGFPPSVRFQQAYAAMEIVSVGAPVLITEIAFRPDGPMGMCSGLILSGARLDYITVSGWDYLRMAVSSGLS